MRCKRYSQPWTVMLTARFLLFVAPALLVVLIFPHSAPTLAKGLLFSEWETSPFPLDNGILSGSECTLRTNGVTGGIIVTEGEKALVLQAKPGTLNPGGYLISAERPGRKFTITTRIALDIQEGQHCIWLAGLGSSSEAPPCELSLALVLNTDPWFGAFGSLRLMGSAALFPGYLAAQADEETPGNTSYYELGGVAPTSDSTYEATLAYDGTTGLTSVIFKDLDNEEVIYSGHLYLNPSSSLLYPGTGVIQTKGEAKKEWHFKLTQFLVKTEAERLGTPIPLHGKVRFAVFPSLEKGDFASGARTSYAGERLRATISGIEAGLPGDLRITALASDKNSTSGAATAGGKVELWHGKATEESLDVFIGSDMLPAGPYRITLEYIEPGYNLHIGEEELSIIEACVKAKVSLAHNRPWDTKGAMNGKITLESDRAIDDIKVSLAVAPEGAQHNQRIIWERLIDLAPGKQLEFPIDFTVEDPSSPQIFTLTGKSSKYVDFKPLYDIPRTFYVSLKGDDRWSGYFPKPNGDGTDGPFRTIVRARDAIRELRKSGVLQGSATVLIREGTYYLDETIVFGPEDSGTEIAPVTYAAYPGEKPILSGGRRIEGFRPGGGLQSVKLPYVENGKWDFRSLFVDDKRQIRARYPNFDPANPYRGGFLYVGSSAGSFSGVVGNIHNPGDWLKYKVDIPTGGEYHVWVLYAAQNRPYGLEDMGGRTLLSIDDGGSTPLMNLPDTGGWGNYKWTHSSSLNMSAGEHVIKWVNRDGGGINLQGFALTDDPDWQPTRDRIPDVGTGKHLVLIPAAKFIESHGRQLTVGTHSAAEVYGPKAFRYNPVEFKPSWAGVPGAEIHIFQSGQCRAFKEIVSIEAVDEENCMVKLGGPECVADLASGDRYFIENVLEELDRPGEWYLDSEAGVLYYWPGEGFSADSVVVAPILKRMFSFEGHPVAPITNVNLVGLTIEETDYLPGDGCIGYSVGNDGVIYMENVVNCSVEGCTFSNIGRYAVCIKGGYENRIVRNDISHSAQGGILLLGTARNKVVDNHIHHCGWVYKHIGGVVLEGTGTDDNIVSHNLIHEISRYGISLKNAGLRNVIEYNYIHHTNTETYDTGGIEVTQHDKEQRSHSIIRYNIVADTIGYSSYAGKPVYMSWGIYLDSYAGGYDVNHNIVYRTHNGGIMLQGGKDNKVWNNIFVDGEAYQGYIANYAGNSTGQVLEQNIFAWTEPDAILFYCGNLSQEVIHIDRNLYYVANGETRGIAGFAEWQRRGFDENSIVADPLFVDPENDNYTLRPESPAFKLGFEPIDTSQIGLLTPRGE